MIVSSILVGYDGSEHSDRALARATEYAAAFGAGLVVVTVRFPLPVLLSPPLEVAPAGGEEGAAGAIHITSEAPDEVIARASQMAPAAELVTREGDAADAIVELAEERGVDLVIVGTSEPGFFERLLGGSVSQDVARQAPCDVLVVH